MAEEAQTPPSEPADPSSLENADDIDALEKSDGDAVVDATNTPNTPGGKPPKNGLKQKLSKFNIYFIVFIFILVVAGGIMAVAYFQSKTAANTSVLKTQSLTDDALKQVASSDATVGSNGTILNVQSSAVFAGKVLMRDGLEVAGNLQIGGTVTLSNITVSGTAQLGQLQVNKNLSVAGDGSIQGALTVAKSLQVNGGGTFSGPISAPQITTSNLQLNSDLVLTKHIIAGGPTPNAARGSAVGGGGSTSISGSDTTGTISVNVGSGAAAGCFVTVNFASKYNSVPHVIVSPIGVDAGTVDYYVTRTTANFSICASTPTPASSFAFDYFVVN